MRRTVWTRGAPQVPKRVTVDGDRLTWTHAGEPGPDYPGSEHMLKEFMRLAAAQPGEMAAFMEKYGILELCGEHHRPDRHHHGRRYCPIAREGDRFYVTVYAVREMARAFDAAGGIAAALSSRTLPEAHLWTAIGRNCSSDWRRGRRSLAEWATDLLSDCGVVPMARWEGSRMVVTSEADGLLGLLAVLLTRELGQGERWSCDVCGGPAERTRPPREGERVYCEKPACKREQQRRNQAAWRARKRSEWQI